MGPGYDQVVVFWWGVTHAHLSALSPEAARRELVESRQTLEAELGLPVRTFCYPYGDWYIMARTDPRFWPVPLTPLIRCQPWYFAAYRRGVLQGPKRLVNTWRRSSVRLRHAIIGG